MIDKKNQTETQMDCNRCGEEFPISSMRKYFQSFGRDDFETVYYCEECWERITENSTMYE